MSSPVPTEWITDELVRFCDIVGGGTPDRAVNDYWGGQIPWVSPTEVTSLASKYISKTKEGLTQLGLDKSSAKLHPPGTLLMTSRASIGYVAINTVPMATNQGFQSLRCKDGTLADYMYQYITWVRPELERLSAGSTFSEISSVNVKRLRVTLPPRPEQQKIATILSSVDDVIEKTRAQIDKLKDLKTAMMQELLTKGIGHTEFKDSPVGRIPLTWSVVSLGEIIGTMIGGVSVNGENRQKGPNEIGVLRVSSVFQGEFFPDEHKTVVQEDLNRVKENPVKDHILFSRANTPQLVGESAYIERTYTDLFLPDKIWMIDVKDRQKTYVKWLSYVLCSGYVRATISDVATGTSGSMKNISKPSLLGIKTALPSLPEQIKIAEILQSVDKGLSSTEYKLSCFLSIKKALMQDLLTGKVRVKPSDS